MTTTLEHLRQLKLSELKSLIALEWGYTFKVLLLQAILEKTTTGVR